MCATFVYCRLCTVERPSAVPGGSSLLAWPARTAEARAQCATCHNPCHCGCSKLQPLHLDDLTLLSVIPYTCKLAKGEAVIENSLTALSLAASGTFVVFSCSDNLERQIRYYTNCLPCWLLAETVPKRRLPPPPSRSRMTGLRSPNQARVCSN